MLCQGGGGGGTHKGKQQDQSGGRENEGKMGRDVIVFFVGHLRCGKVSLLRID